MISARLIKELEREGFNLNFPSYDSNEERIAEILKENDPRLDLAMPLLLRYSFDYDKITNMLSLLHKNGKSLIKRFNKVIMIYNKIFMSEGMDNRYLEELIKNKKIKEKIEKSEFEEFLNSFREFTKNRQTDKEQLLKEQIDIRTKLTMNKALSNIFSPGKMRIMDKIFRHEKLTNTELKYYYKSIRPLILSTLNEDLQKYAGIIESTKKYRES